MICSEFRSLSACKAGKIPSLAVVQAATHNMRYDLQDLTLRALILVAGGLAAALLAIKGYGQALPAVAFGGALGAFFAGRVQPRIEE